MSTGLDPKRFPKGFDAHENGYLAVEPMPDGRAWCLLALTLGRLRIVIAEDQFTAGEHWCYDNNLAATMSYKAGPDVEPIGWSRHMHPNGDLEYPRD